MDNKLREILADEYGDLDYKIKVLEEKKKAIRDELVTLVGDVPVVGLRWTVSKSEANQTSLDTKAVREFLGDTAKRFERSNHVSKILVKQTRVLGKTAEVA